MLNKVKCLIKFFNGPIGNISENIKVFLISFKNLRFLNSSDFENIIFFYTWNEIKKKKKTTMMKEQSH